MDYTEIINKAADEYITNATWVNKFADDAFKDGITSPLAKQITEIEKLEFADKFIEGNLSVTGAMNGYGDAIEIDKIKITELTEPTPPKINAE